MTLEKTPDLHSEEPKARGNFMRGVFFNARFLATPN